MCLICNLINGRKPDRDSNNPADYPAAIEITDGNALMILAKMDHLKERADRLKEELQVVSLMRDAERANLYLRLDEAYPGIRTDEHPVYGFRRWEGKVYYVAYAKEPIDGVQVIDIKLGPEGPEPKGER